MARARIAHCVVVALAVFFGAAPVALGHSAFVGSQPPPGARLAAAPKNIELTFTEPLDARLSRARLLDGDGRRVAAQAGVVGRTRLVLRPGRALATGPYRVEWHTVSTDDGHALEGTFSFGVRASAVGGVHDVEQSPLARDGWLRVLARGAMYATLLLFTGALALDALLGRGGRLWLAPAALDSALPRTDLDAVDRRYRRLVIDVGILAAGAAALSAVAEAADAAGGLSARGLADYLLSNAAGLNRVAVVLFLLLACGLAALRFRVAAVAALGALVAVSSSGHANASSPRGLAVANDWLHLTAAALWLGGIAMLVIAWGPVVRRAALTERLAVTRHVLPRFGRVALPAFAAVVATGLVSAAIELGHLSALWATDYGRVLMVKIDLVAFIAAASYVHALRLRPRLLRANPHPRPNIERRHWRLLGAEPALGVGVIAAVAVLVAFPLPPRQLADAGDARENPAPVPCDPCPLPRPARGELAVAEQGASNVVAAWVRRDGRGLSGTVRLYAIDHRPARDPFTVLDGRQSACGVGCARFRVRSAPAKLRVAVSQRGRTFIARLPVRWRVGEESRARALVEQAQRAMRALRSARESERVSSVPGLSAVTTYRLRAPNRMAYRTNAGVESVVVGGSQWTRARRGLRWQKGEFGGGLPFTTRSWFTWTTYARHSYLLDEREQGGRRVAEVALMDPGTPAWWRLSIELRTGRVLEDRLITYGHFMTQRFFAFNRSMRIEPPGARRRGR